MPTETLPNLEIPMEEARTPEKKERRTVEEISRREIVGKTVTLKTLGNLDPNKPKLETIAHKGIIIGPWGIKAGFPITLQTTELGKFKLPTELGKEDTHTSKVTKIYPLGEGRYEILTESDNTYELEIHN